MAEKKNNDIQIFARNKKEVLLRSLNKYSLKNCLKNSEYSINLTYFFSESNTQESLVSSIRGLRSRGLFEAAKASLKGFFLPGKMLPKLLKSQRKFSQVKQFKTLLKMEQFPAKIRNPKVQDKQFQQQLNLRRPSKMQLCLGFNCTSL